MPHAYLIGHLHPFAHVAQQIVAQQFAAFAAHALIGFGIHIRVGVAVRRQQVCDSRTQDEFHLRGALEDDVA